MPRVLCLLAQYGGGSVADKHNGGKKYVHLLLKVFVIRDEPPGTVFCFKEYDNPVQTHNLDI